MKWVKNIGNDSVTGEASESNLTQILSKRKTNPWPNRKVKRFVDSLWETSLNLIMKQLPGGVLCKRCF